MNRIEKIECVKKVLFGNQKQADSINDAVCGLVVDYLNSKGLDTNLDSIDTAATAIESAIRKFIENPTQDVNAAIFIKLTTGERGYSNIMSGEVITLEVYTPNPDSPKHYFVARVFGDDAAAVPVDLHSAEGVAKAVTEEASDINDYKTYVQDLKKKMIPLVPSVIKEALSDENEQCLCIAQYYFK